jgi:class 3 adenylate cyclase/tetratricopeptide (TPR) repeat protein
VLAPEIGDSNRESSERRFLTIVFVDLIGYTELSERLDPEDLGMLQRRYQKLALTTMERYGGFVARFVGDGILVYFGYPRAHERDAERAVRAALELLQRLRHLDTDVEGHTIPVFNARVGIHSGLVVMAQELMSAGTSVPGIVGEAANLAARLQTEAPPGGILISGETLELVQGLIECEPLGTRPIKGLSREISVHRVVGVLPGARRTATSFQRGATRMVGREASVERILARWDTACRETRCQTVAVVAEAGAGKTRLILELCSRPELAEAVLLQASCQEIFASTPLYPVGSFLWARAGLTIEDSASESVLKVSRLLDEARMNTAENKEIVLSLLGLAVTGATVSVAPTPQAFRHKQYEFVVTAFERLARGQPTVLWIEDTHWLDPSSAELLHEIVAALKNSPVMVLLTMRSYPAGPALPEADEVVHLEQMSDRDCLEIARSIPGAEILTPEVLDQAVKAAEGVPLFLEQLVIALLDERVQARGHTRRLGGVPLMLAEMLSERLDRLPGGRRIVQAAACIGRSFVPDFLLAVLEEDATRVARPLEALVAAEILLPKRYGAEIRYEFRHALLQRMAYESMVQTERRAMHGRIVDVLSQRAVSRPTLPEVVAQHLAVRPTLPEVMAHHLTEAGRTLEAIEAWLKAGTSAATRSAHIEAVDHLRRGIGLLDKIDEPKQRRQLELNLQVSMMGSILATQGATSPELHACCERGLQLCGEGDATPLVFPFAFGEFTFVNCRGSSEEAERLARMFLSLSERNGFDSGRVIGHRMLGMSLMTQGVAPKAREQIESSLALYSPERDAATTHMFGQNTEVHSKSLLSFTLFCLGEVDAALETGVDALRTADALRHPHSTAIPLVYVGGWVFGLCDATEPMTMESRRLIQLAEQHRLSGFRAHGTAFFGWALCQRGELAQGIAAIEQAVAAFDAISFHLALAGHLANLADAQRRLGRIREAHASCRRALELLPEGSRWLEPEVRRVAGLVAADLQATKLDDAEAMFRGAVSSAQHFGFPVMERRCLSSLAKFLGSHRSDPDVDARLRALAHLDNLDRRVERALAAPPSHTRQ